MSPLDLFIRDLDERKGKIPCCQEVTDIQTSVEKILKDLLLKVEKEYPFLKTTLINSGSFYEGTKVGKPDEFDYLVQLDYFAEPEDILLEQLPRSTMIVIPSPSGYKKLRKLRLVSLGPGFDRKICVKTPFVRTLNDKAKGLEAHGIKVLSSASKTHGPAYCLELEWTGGERYKGLKISVDLSLAVKINSCSSTMDVDLESPAGEVIKSCLDSVPYFFAVSAYDGCPDTPSDLFDNFKESDLGVSAEKRDVSLRCSQSCLEQALFNHFGSDSGQSVCLRVLKMLRDMLLEEKSFAVCSDANDSVTDHWRFLAEFGVVGDFCKLICKWMDAFGSFLDAFFGLDSGDKFISSYTLKTAVLLEWDQNPEAEQWAGSNLSERLLNILRNLRDTSKDGQLCSFFYKDYKVSSRLGWLGEVISRRITILLSVLSATRDAGQEYKFEECLGNVVKDLKWARHKMNLHTFLLAALLDLFSCELNKVIPSKSLAKQHFCSIYIQALLDKLVAEVKLILPEPDILEEADRTREAKELFTEIASKRMEGLKNLPSFTFSLQAFKAHELAELLQFLCGIFKEDIEILMNELSLKTRTVCNSKKDCATCKYLMTICSV